MAREAGARSLAVRTPGGGVSFEPSGEAQAAGPPGAARRGQRRQRAHRRKRRLPARFRRRPGGRRRRSLAARRARAGAPPRFDLVLMDLKMPGLDGLQATRRLRRLEVESRSPRTPVIALTANALEDERRACKAAGFDAFLVKPFDFGDLRRKSSACAAEPDDVRAPSTGRHKSFRRTWFCFADKAYSRGRWGGADIRIEAAGGRTRVPAPVFAPKHDLAGLGPVLARAGALEARLATTKKDVRRAQKLRYRVFFEEGGAAPDPTARIIRRDVCPFDSVSDHLIVVDKTVRLPRRLAADRRRLSSPAPGRGRAQFRLLQRARIRRRGADRAPPDDPLPRGRPRLRRADPPRPARARTPVARALGLCAPPRMDAMIGCASLPGADPALHADAIRALRQPAAIRPGGSRRGRSAPSRSARARPRRPTRARSCASCRRSSKAIWRLGATFSPVPGRRPGLQHHRPLRRDAARATSSSAICDHFGVAPAPAPLAA